MGPSSALASGVQRLLTGERPDPRAAQALFLVPVVVDVALHLAVGTPFSEEFRLGLLVLAVPTLGALGIGAGLVSDRWTIWLPVLDIVALGIFRLSPQTALGVAVAFPAIWLGLQFGRKGVLVTALTVVPAYVVPTVVTYGGGVDSLSRVTQVTLMAVICSGAVAVTTELWRQQAADSRSAQARLALAVEDALEQRRLTDSIVHSVDVGLVSIDAEGKYDAMNPRHHDFMALAFPGGYDGRAGQRGFIFSADGVSELAVQDMPTVRAARGETFRDYLMWVGQDPAERRALAVSSSPHYSSSGEFAGAVLAYHDITELVAAARIKEEFVASVSHELRTPLTSIIGYVDIILDDEDALGADARRHLGVVQRNARRLHRLVDDLLATALQSVTTVLDLEVVGVRQMLEHSAIEAGKVAAAAGLTFDLDVSGPELKINGDSERLAQVFDNLFSNAIKYTPAGGHVEGAVSQVGHEAVVRVRDTGRGIAESELEAVFTKFFRSDTVRSDAIPGVGLGLAITKTIIDAHGGRITVESELGQGSTFEVRLPLVDPPMVPAA